MVCLLGGQEFRAQVTGVAVGVAALTWFPAFECQSDEPEIEEEPLRMSLPELELGMCWQETLMVGWATEGFLATSGIEGRSVGGSHFAS